MGGNMAPSGGDAFGRFSGDLPPHMGTEQAPSQYGRSLALFDDRQASMRGMMQQEGGKQTFVLLMDK